MSSNTSSTEGAMSGIQPYKKRQNPYQSPDPKDRRRKRGVRATMKLAQKNKKKSLCKRKPKIRRNTTTE